MIKHRIDPTSDRFFAVLSFLVFVLVGYFYLQELNGINKQMQQNLLERADEAAQRLTKSVAPTAWEVYQRSTDRQFPEQLAADILDSELNVDFIVAITVLGNFGHVLMGRQKTEDGLIVPVTHVSEIAPRYTQKIRSGMVQGAMTIGHIEIYYTDAFHLARTTSLKVASTFRFFMVTFLLQMSVYLLYRASHQRKQILQTVENLKETQEKLVESEKLAGLGSLVAGIAHELNTPLGIALTSFSSVETETKGIKRAFDSNQMTKSSLDDYLQHTLQTVHVSNQSLYRAIELVNHFKQISSDQVVEDTREINIRQYIDEVMVTLAIGIKRAGCQFTISGGDALVVRSIPGAIAQVLTNLVNNALLHAFSDGASEPGVTWTAPAEKRITIRIDDYDQIFFTVSISDNGRGMTESTRKRIFDPFFTTKRGKGGTGLGMNIVFNIVTKKLQGHISVASTPGEGTRFDIKLPKKLQRISHRQLTT